MTRRQCSIWILLTWLGLMGLIGIKAPVWAEDSNTAVASAQAGLAAIPVLCYHRFGPYPANDAYAITTAEFKKQLAIIQEEGFEPITTSRLAEGVAGKITLPAKPLLITVDDGYKDFITQAKPLLEQYHYPATLFVYTNFINSQKALTQVQLQELQSQGFEIGCHSATHALLTRYPRSFTPEQREKALKTELIDARAQLQEWSKGQVVALAYPYGLWDQEVARIAEQAGFALMFTVNPGTNALDYPKICWNRIMILHGTKPKTFRAMLRDLPLAISEWNPPLGQRIPGPIQEVSLKLSPRVLPLIAPASMQVKRGPEKIPLSFEPLTGEVKIQFLQPWTSGTDLLVLTAKDLEGKNTYKASWLIVVNRARAKKGN